MLRRTNASESNNSEPNNSEPNKSAQPPSSQCSLCGHHTVLVELPGIPEKYCSACSADVATSVLLKTEINAAWLSGERYDSLAFELAQLSTRLVARAQST